LKHRWIKLAVALLSASLVYRVFESTPELATGLGILTLVAILWVTEAIHITFTALLIPVLAVISGLFTVPEAFREFANPIIFLFLGGFSLAAAMRKQGLDKRLACNLVRLSRGRMDHAMLLLFTGTAFLSMWISNTATTAMMLPLAMGLLAHHPYEENKKTYWYLLLGVAYSANIGGIGTLVGSPPNAIAAANAGMTFLEWMKIGLPAVLVMFPLMLIILWLVFRPGVQNIVIKQERNPPLNGQQKATLAVFLLTVTLWLLSKPICDLTGIGGGFDAIVAMLALLLIGILRLATWKDIEHAADWGVLLLFGGGLTLSAIMKTTGASLFLAESVSMLLGDAPLFVFILTVAAFIVFLTEISSNTASSALLIPIFISIAQTMGLPPVLMAALIAVGASCAFMLPVATPPNAIVFGSGYVPQKEMMRVGLLLNLCMIFIIASGAWLFLAI
jgi:sodium-dependent dicarboxylate transporter 2/3/5